MPQAPTDIVKEADASRADDTEGLAQAVDQLVSEIDRTVRTFDQDDAAPADPADADAFEPIAEGPIDEQVDELVDDAFTARPAPPAFEAPSSIDDLDEALASAADENDDLDLEGDFEESSSAYVAAAAAPPPAPKQSPAPPTPVNAPAAPAAAPPVAAPEPAAAEPAKPSVDKAAALLASIEKPARLLSAPLRLAPEAHRDTIGWIALNTLFLAVCVWLYVLLLR